MKIELGQHTLAIAVGVLALAIATTGTAAAVTGTAMNITDPVNAAYKAHVDVSGHLLTTGTVTGPVSTRPVPPATVFNSAYYIGIGTTVLAGPTTATLAVTRFAVMNSGQNYSYADTNFVVQLTRRVPDNNGSCYSGSLTNLVSVGRTPVGADLEHTFQTPLVFKPAGNTPYCVTVEMYSETGSPGTYYLPFAQLSGYVVSGSYAGPPLVPSPVGRPVLRTPLDPHPAGAAPTR